jgi:hypothetical protein
METSITARFNKEPAVLDRLIKAILNNYFVDTATLIARVFVDQKLGLFSKRKIQQETKEFQIDNDAESKRDEKEFSNQALTKPKELYVTLDGAQPKKEHVEHNANERKESKEKVVLATQLDFIIPDFDGEIGKKKINHIIITVTN